MPDAEVTASILIVADTFDAHADVVGQQLSSKGVDYFRLNIDVPALHSTKIGFDGADWNLNQNGKAISSATIKVVWPRRLTVSLDLDQQTRPEDASFKLWRAEWNRSLYGLYNHLGDAFWMNSVGAAALADNKYHQMRVAKSIGLHVPETITSNSKSELIKFAQKFGQVALKFMSQEIYRTADGQYQGIYVNKLSEDDLADFGDASENPVTLQRYIEKDYEVRYTYVDGAHIACKIESQNSSRANIDWRRYDVPNTPHSQITPPHEVQKLVELLMSCLNITYGALDFIVDKSGKWWYLEVNSAGQWLWIEDLVGLPISATIARVLVDRSVGAEK